MAILVSQLSCSDNSSAKGDFIVTSSWPIDGETNVYPKDQYVVEFSDNIDPYSVQGEISVYIEDAAGVKQSISKWVDAKTLTIIPSPPLQYSSSYRLVVTTNVKSNKGTNLTNSHVVSFTTSST